MEQLLWTARARDEAILGSALPHYYRGASLYYYSFYITSLVMRETGNER